MTRINLVDPSLLTDQHLMAEYREIKMVAAALARSRRTKTVEEIVVSIPPTFRLGSGHVKFFYDKSQYLFKRYGKIRIELLARQYKIGDDFIYDPLCHHITACGSLNKDWMPDEEDLRIIQARIRDRINMKPEWYRYFGQPIEDWRLKMLTFVD